MNINEFRQYGKQMIDLVANYWESLRKRAPLPNVKLGFINELVLPLFIDIMKLYKFLVVDRKNHFMRFILDIFGKFYHFV